MSSTKTCHNSSMFSLNSQNAANFPVTQRLIVGWKPILYLLLGAKINLSGISPAKRSRSGPNSVYVDMSTGDNVQGILGAIGTFWAKWGLGRVLRSQEFYLCGNPDDLSATSQRLIFAKFSHETYFDVPSMNPDIFENFHLRHHLPPKS